MSVMDKVNAGKTDFLEAMDDDNVKKASFAICPHAARSEIAVEGKNNETNVLSSRKNHVLTIT
jgi:hypothetical protein